MGSVLNLGAIRVALADQVRARLGDAMTVYPRPPAAPSMPCVMVRFGDPYVNYFVTMGDVGLADVRLTLDVLIPMGHGESGEEAMDEALSFGSATSVPDAVFADRTLGGEVQDCVVLVASEPEWVNAGNGTPALLSRLPVQIIVKKEAA